MSFITRLLFGQNAAEYAERKKPIIAQYELAEITMYDMQLINAQRLSLVDELLPKNGSFRREISRVAAICGVI